ncbi:Kynurenine formamidase [Liparis tanakae]|uniref:Kynurenine formamidase n=1 Tax=Liparis tanakae TaxID=230148 RepID=A0A4Z2FW72_9TELE|nr:Kynurenine formamidase [Liparis tanakae]
MMHWTEMKKDELERQYSPSLWSHRMSADDVIEAHVKALKEGTEQARGLAQTLLNVPYGEGDGEKLDVYVPSTNSLGTDIKEESGFMAVPLIDKGVVVVAVDYDTAPKGNMDLMVSQVRRSVVSVVQQYSHISGLYLCGHSAGAHLAAMVLSTDWSQYSITPQIKGEVKFGKTREKMQRLRRKDPKLVPQLKLSSSGCQIIVAVAENDSPEFRKQSEEYCKTLEASGLNVTMEDVADTDHFNIIEQLVDGEYYLTKLLLKTMGRS